MSPKDKPLVWLHGQVASPPFSREARIEAGYLLRLLQQGAKLAMPHSRPMPSIGGGCHELRVNDQSKTWRIMYRVDFDAVIIAEVFEKKTQQTPKSVLDVCRKRLGEYDQVTRSHK
jgi:phage-related protein